MMFRLNNLSFLIIPTLIILSLTSCDKTNRENGHQNLDEFEKEGSIYEHPGLSKYDPPIEIHLIRETNTFLEDLLEELPDETLEDNRWSELYEQLLGVEINYDWVASGNFYQQKLAVALASGNLPDVVRVNSQRLRELSNAGLIQDLSTVYEEYATPFTKEIFNQEGAGSFESATIGGKLMGIPEIESSIERAQFIWIRTDWMERLGLEPPKTMDDVLTISKAFTEGDPNQSGENDTFGLAITHYLWDPVMGLLGFMAGYNAYPTLWIEDGSGGLVFGGIQPEVKAALKALQYMYRNGQLDSEFGFTEGNKVIEQIAEGKIGMFYGEQWGSFIAGNNRNVDPDAQWQAYPIVSDSGELAKVPLKFGGHQFLAVREGYKHPEAIIKMINLHLEKNWGETADYEKYYSTPKPVWQLSPVTPFPPLKNLEAYRQLEKVRQTGDSSILKPEAKAIQKNIDNYLLRNEESGWGWERTYGPSGAFAILEQYVQNNQLLYDRFVGAPTATMIEMKPLMNDLMHETFVNIILGRPIEEFDKFVDDWNQMGGSQITVEVNQWYSERGRIED
ncbi:putative aldouronate transport system substrate-binding protein [Evansella vedderi]|uniref:Aldouronate transport system substrate-binding protein n=1 Tax=Evansella vedderi TaxID=38282 RepID=A0ABT9ZPQ1_9BACI|nr:extracellular solute-binding protein [Evansella vedderi]MDQ0253216.1 putative aldouronate transport system substrate-binding protein [Evansella vedderi]